MNTLVVSTALKPNSKTLTAARVVQQRLQTSGITTDLADLTVEPLPICDGASCYADERVLAMTRRVTAAQLIVMCFPRAASPRRGALVDYTALF